MSSERVCPLSYSLISTQIGASEILALKVQSFDTRLLSLCDERGRLR